MQKKYELLYVLNGTLSDDVLNSQMERVQEIVAASAEIEDVFIWGRRKMAYEIQDIREGFYVIVHFLAEPDAPKELERLLRISDAVMRYLIVVAEGSFMPPVKRVGEVDEPAAEVKAEGAAQVAEALAESPEAKPAEAPETAAEAATEAAPESAESAPAESEPAPAESSVEAAE